MMKTKRMKIRMIKKRRRKMMIKLIRRKMKTRRRKTLGVPPRTTIARAL